VKQFSYIAPFLLALAAPASAQPAPAPVPPVTPTAPIAGTPATPAAVDPAVPAEGDAVTPASGEEAPPVEPVPPVGPVPPVEPPPPPPPPRVPGLLPSSIGDQSLVTHAYALDKETTVPDHTFTASLFADYWFTAGPRVGGTAGMFRSFEAHFGVLLDTLTTMSASGAPSTSSSSTRIMYGASIGLVSYAGIQLAGGMIFLTGQGNTAAMVPTGQLTVPLDAHWLPFSVANTRVRITYPIGLGIEWGIL
jgi:hypothetical protein